MSDDVAFGLVIGITAVLAVAGVIVSIATRWWWLLAATVAFFAVMSVWLFGFAAFGWHSLAENGCIANRSCYCELQDPVTGMIPAGKIRQPGGTISAFAPILAAFVIFGELEWNRVNRRLTAAAVPNEMVLPSAYSITYALIVLLLGPGSMLFHASMKAGPSLLDPVSIVVYAQWVLCYGVFSPLLRGNEGVRYFVVFASFIAGSAALVAIAASGHEDIASYIGIGALGVWLVVALILDIIARAGAPNAAEAARRFPSAGYRNPLWNICAILTFGVSFLFWILSQTGGPLCVDPSSSILQGHILWHIGAMALAPYFIYRYLHSRRSPPG